MCKAERSQVRDWPALSNTKYRDTDHGSSAAKSGMKLEIVKNNKIQSPSRYANFYLSELGLSNKGITIKAVIRIRDPHFLSPRIWILGYKFKLNFLKFNLNL